MNTYYVTYRTRCVKVSRDGQRLPQEWSLLTTVVAQHPVLELLRWKKDLLYHNGSAPLETETSWLENEWQVLWWSEIPGDVYEAAHRYEDEVGEL